MNCGFEWGSADDYDDEPPNECDGEHACIDTLGHEGDHECACSESCMRGSEE